MQKLKNNKGITLIALIITIIVMLILVAVTINVALNGGLFEKAKAAASQTEQEALYEEIIGAIETTKTGEINVLATYNAFKEGKEVELITTGDDLTEANTKNIVFTVKGKTGEYTYSITTGKVIKGAIPWVKWGLTSGHVNFDKTYNINNIEIYDDDYIDKITLYSDGGMWILWKIDSESNVKSSGEEMEEAIEAEEINISNVNTISVEDGDFVFSDDGKTLEMYVDNTLIFTFTAN